MRWVDWAAGDAAMTNPCLNLTPSGIDGYRSLIGRLRFVRLTSDRLNLLAGLGYFIFDMNRASVGSISRIDAPMDEVGGLNCADDVESMPRSRRRWISGIVSVESLV